MGLTLATQISDAINKKPSWTLKNPNNEDCVNLPGCFDPLIERCANLWDVFDYRYYIDEYDYVTTWERYQAEKDNPKLRHGHDNNFVNQK